MTAPACVSVVRYELNGYDDICRCFHGADLEVVPLDTRPASGVLELYALGGLVLSSGALCGTQRTRGVIGADAYTFGVPFDPGIPARVSQWGVVATPGDVFLMPPTTDQDGHVMGGSRYVTLTVDRATFDALRLNELGISSLERGRHTHVRSSPDAANDLLPALACVVSTLQRTARGITPAQASHLQDRMLSPMVTALARGSEEANGRTHTLQGSTIRHVEEWIDSHDSAMLTARVLALHLGLSLRSLQRLFTLNLGVGMQHYLTLRRLARVHRTLVAAHPGETTVSQVAAAHGFLEFGRLAGFYRRWYGELPSVTLARPPAARVRTPSFPEQGA